jgi:hypothetical protein
LPRNTSNLGQKRSAYASTAKRLSDEQVLKEEKGTFPARIIAKEERVAGRLPFPLRNEGAELWLGSEAVLDEWRQVILETDVLTRLADDE